MNAKFWWGTYKGTVAKSSYILFVFNVYESLGDGRPSGSNHAMTIGCSKLETGSLSPSANEICNPLRRNELAELDVATIQQREGRLVLVDLEGKGRRILTVAIPIWVKQGINAWMTAAGIEEGRPLRSVSKSGKINDDSLSDWAVRSVVEQSSKQIGIEHFGAHDLRRTCAKPCRKNGGDLEQIKFLLGHSSIQTTERYLGSEQDIEIAVNDNLGL
jgi:integrase